MRMLEVLLKGHDKFYGVTDVVRLFYDGVTEDKSAGRVICESAPDAKLICELDLSGRSVTSWGAKRYIPQGRILEPGREIKRSLYLAMRELAGHDVPWGCLTGIRPTLVASEENSPEALVRDYYVREDKARIACETAREELRLLDRIPAESVNIYVGIPFCPSRCSYCSFIAEDTAHHMDRLNAYEKALEGEIRLLAPRIKRDIATLYVGGGTPTVLPDAEFARLLDCIYENMSVNDNTEVTVEAGRPDTITEYKLEAMKEHGISRICINPQTMRSDTLAKLNRRHTAEDVVSVYRLAASMGFDLINMDLIAGLPFEDASSHIDSVKALIDLQPANITVHTLYKKRRATLDKSVVMDRDDTRGSVDDAVREGYDLLYEAGYHPYYMYRQKDTGHGLENTGFARGDTGCLYNVAMMTDFRDVLSFGAGGSSKRCFIQAEGPDSKRRVERCATIKDAIGYIARYEEMAERKAGFFEL